VLFSCPLLLVTTVSSRKQHIEVWNSNNIATIFHGLTGHRMENLGHMVNPAHMEAAAKNINVQLRKDDGHLRLHDVHQG